MQQFSVMKDLSLKERPHCLARNLENGMEKCQTASVSDCSLQINGRISLP